MPRRFTSGKLHPAVRSALAHRRRCTQLGGLPTDETNDKMQLAWLAGMSEAWKTQQIDRTLERGNQTWARIGLAFLQTMIALGALAGGRPWAFGIALFVAAFIVVGVVRGRRQLRGPGTTGRALLVEPERITKVAMGRIGATVSVGDKDAVLICAGSFVPVLEQLLRERCPHAEFVRSDVGVLVPTARARWRRDRTPREPRRPRDRNR
jgi:hypothetical protein